MRKFILYWLFATACFSVIFVQLHEHQIHERLAAEEAMPGEAFFEEPVTLNSGDIDVCGDLIQKNVLNRKPKISMIANVLAEFKKIDEKTGTTTLWSTLEVSISLNKDNVKAFYDTDIKDRIPKTPIPGTYQWTSTLNFASPSGYPKSISYSSNPFKVYCSKSS